MTLKSMNKNATIKIYNFQPGEQDTVTLETDASFYQKEERFYVLYLETDADTGREDSVLLKIADGAVTMKRMGAFSSEMEFVPGKDTICHYRTPYGTIEMTVCCKRAEAELLQGIGGTIRLEYTLQIGSESYENNLTIQVKTRKDNL